MNNCKIQTGDWVGSALGSSPEWTPYAQAIADHYPIQIPWYLTLNATLTDPFSPPPPLPPPRVTQVTRPYQYDVLILGAHATITRDNDAGPYGNFIYLNITHKESGVPWAVPNRIGYFPLPALAGIASIGQVPEFLLMPVLKWPEAFFLPAHTQLKLDWTYLDNALGATTTVVNLVLIGVQLINPAPGFRAPQKITMPNGGETIVGSRLPWFATIPMGEFQSRSISDWRLSLGQDIIQFFPPQDCSVEVHDAYSNAIGTNILTEVPAQQLAVKLTDMGPRTFWTRSPSPLTAIFSGQLLVPGAGFVHPAMPFTKPYLLKRGHRIQASMQNNDTFALDTASLTLRGVRLCEY